jgi:hypothetical protein
MDERTAQSGRSAKADTSLSPVVPPWRTPAVILACGCLIAMIGFGARSGLGFFLTPMSSAHGWGRDVFALALAIQMLLWGAAQPLAGAVADRYGPAPVLSIGAVLYALGLATMAYAATPGMLHLTAGAVIGFGLAGSSFTIVIGAFGKLMPPQWRSLAFGAGTAAGSFGQFLFSPLAVALIDRVGWQDTLVIFAAVVLLIMPLSFALASRRQAGAPAAASNRGQQSVVEALSEALGHKSYVLLVLGFFTCGFQIFFIAVHLPAYLVDRGLPPRSAAGRSPASACSTSSAPSRRLARRVHAQALPPVAHLFRARGGDPRLHPAAAERGRDPGLLGGAGLLWLSTVPPTSGLVALMFGTRWLAMLFGFAFFSHQVGGFLGCGSAACCSSAPDPTTRSGGSRSCSGSCQRRSISDRGEARCRPLAARASAADLKFPATVPRVHPRNFKSKSGTRIIELLVPFGFEVRARGCPQPYHELRKPGTRGGRRRKRGAKVHAKKTDPRPGVSVRCPPAVGVWTPGARPWSS